MAPEALADLHARCFTTPRPWSAQEFDALLSSPGIFLADSTQGFALGRAIAGEAELLTIAVAPEARGQGAGRALLRAFEDQAHALGATEAFLEVAADNTVARALYTSAGYSEAGLRKSYYHSPTGAHIDALVLRKSLT